MEIKIWWSDKVKRKPNDFRTFVQQMANRLLVGQIRYGEPRKEQRYMSRLREELKAYRKTGNKEHLLNIANYAWLESVAPEHEKAHFDDKVDSVTRRSFGGSCE